MKNGTTHKIQLVLMMIILFGKRTISGWMHSPMTLSFRKSISSSSLLLRFSSSVGTSEYEVLRKKLREWDDAYYNRHESLVSDDEYDGMKRRMEELQPITHVGIASSSSSSAKDRKKFVEKMLSLDNGWNEEHLKSFVERTNNNSSTEFMLEPKLDGVSLNIQYDSNGKYLWAATRGDGTEGDDVTKAITYISNIPLIIPSSDLGEIVEVRGEVMLSKQTFANFPKQQYSNARNAASGILQRKDTEEASQWQSHLEFIAYHIITESKKSFDGQQTRSLLQKWGYTIPEPVWYLSKEELIPPSQDNSDNKEEGTNKCQEMLTICRKDDYPYQIDGIVLKVNSGDLRKQLGSTSRAPKWALAYKASPTTAVSTILDVIVQVGRTGRMTPVAIIQPVTIDGVNITRATLHNFIQAQQILSTDTNGDQDTTTTNTTTIPVNSTVLVSRAGDVIPQIVQTISIPPTTNNDENNNLISLEIPKNCPVCQTPTEIEDIMVLCPNVQCPSRSIQKLVHAVSRNALDIPNLSQQRLEQLNITYTHELFDLTVEYLEGLPGWATQSATSLVNSLQNGKQVSLSAFINSLGIRHVGKHTSKLLAQHYQTVDAFLSKLQNYKGQEGEEEELSSSVKGIGPSTIASLQHFGELHYEEAYKLSQKLTVVPEKTIIPPVSLSTGSSALPWNGWKVVFTGGFSNMTRSQAQEKAQTILGAASTPSSLSKSTNLLIIGEKTSPKKLSKATELNISIMNEAEFQQLLTQYETKV